MAWHNILTCQTKTKKVSQWFLGEKKPTYFNDYFEWNRVILSFFSPVSLPFRLALIFAVSQPVVQRFFSARYCFTGASDNLTVRLKLASRKTKTFVQKCGHFDMIFLHKPCSHDFVYKNIFWGIVILACMFQEVTQIFTKTTIQII